MLLRIRVALSQERRAAPHQPLEQWQTGWRNTVGPFLLQLSAGFASAVLLLGSVADCWSACSLIRSTPPRRMSRWAWPLPRVPLSLGVALPDVDQIGTVNGSRWWWKPTSMAAAAFTTTAS
jgi:hypothetical protein